jgi:hypothetical protein
MNKLFLAQSRLVMDVLQIALQEYEDQEVVFNEDANEISNS